MAKRFRPVDRDQQFLLPTDMAEWLPADHLAWFVISVVQEMDLPDLDVPDSRGGAGRAAFDPRMLLTLLIYAYACGERSSRQIERLCSVDVAFRVICAQDVPDHSTIARFRQRRELLTGEVFAQVLRLCGRAGLGRVGVIALDGTKIAANASREANRDGGWLREQAARIVAQAGAVDAAEDALFGAARGDELPAELVDPRSRPGRIRHALAQLEQQDAQAAQAAQARAVEQRARGAAYEQQLAQSIAGPAGQPGADQPGAGSPVAPRKARRPPAGADPVRLAELRLARERQHAQDRLTAHQARRDQAKAQGQDRRPGLLPVPVEQSRPVVRARAVLAELTAAAAAAAAAAAPGSELAVPPGRPGPAVAGRRNLTDPDSRLMPSRHGYVQGYNAQLVVTDDQIILAAQLTQSPNDMASYQPMVAAAQAAAATMARPGRQPEPIGTVLADAGYLSTDNLTAPGPDRLIALGKRHQLERDARDSPTSGPPPPHASPLEAMGHRLRTEQGMALYRRRGVTVEPVNGHVKDRLGLRQFARRGLQAANSELVLAASVANLLKLYRATPTAT